MIRYNNDVNYRNEDLSMAKLSNNNLNEKNKDLEIAKQKTETQAATNCKYAN